MSQDPHHIPSVITPDEIARCIAKAHHLRALAFRTALLALVRLPARALRAGVAGLAGATGRRQAPGSGGCGDG